MGSGRGGTVLPVDRLGQRVVIGGRHHRQVDREAAGPGAAQQREGRVLRAGVRPRLGPRPRDRLEHPAQGRRRLGGLDAAVPVEARCGRDAAVKDAAVEDAASDAGKPIGFSTARIRYRIGATVIGEAIDVPCPEVYVAEVPAEPARYDIDVGLLDGTNPLGQTICTVTTQSGTTSSAVCP